MKITTMRMVLEFWSEEVYIDLSLVTDRCGVLVGRSYIDLSLVTDRCGITFGFEDG